MPFVAPGGAQLTLLISSVTAESRRRSARRTVAQLSFHDPELSAQPPYTAHSLTVDHGTNTPTCEFQGPWR